MPRHPVRSPARVAHLEAVVGARCEGRALAIRGARGRHEDVGPVPPRIAGVIVRGEWYPRACLASLREAAARRLARCTTSPRLEASKGYGLTLRDPALALPK